MCRIVAYFGPPLRLSALITEPSHGLKEQSQAAREMRGGSVAGDGWGIGWFAEKEDRPGVIKSILPLWSDQNAQTAEHAISSRCIVGHIRHASAGSEVCFTNTPLYVYEKHLYTLNGELKPWPGSLSRSLRSCLDAEHEAGLQGSTDAEMLGALWATHLERIRPTDPANALRQALREARNHALERGGSVRASVIVADHSGFVAARFSEPVPPESLYYLAKQPRWNGGMLVASEPLDDGPGWKPVEPSTLVKVSRDGLTCEPLGITGDAE